MRTPLLAALLLASTVPAFAQGAPDLRGTWSGVARSVVYGSGYHHPGSETAKDGPVIREVKFTYTIAGQDGRLLWGTTASPSFQEPFAWAISEVDGTIVGADTDGQYRLRMMTPDRMELCYTHTELSPTKSIVASCFMIDRQK